MMNCKILSLVSLVVGGSSASQGPFRRNLAAVKTENPAWYEFDMATTTLTWDKPLLATTTTTTTTDHVRALETTNSSSSVNHDEYEGACADPNILYTQVYHTGGRCGCDPDSFDGVDRIICVFDAVDCSLGVCLGQADIWIFHVRTRRACTRKFGPLCLFVLVDAGFSYHCCCFVRIVVSLSLSLSSLCLFTCVPRFSPCTTTQSCYCYCYCCYCYYQQ